MPDLSVVIQVELPSGDEIAIVRRRFRGPPEDGPRVAIVAGIRGDAPEGIRVAHCVAESLATCEERLRGTVDIYPCVNPLAAHRGSRVWPFFEVDLNRRFPGEPDGHPPDSVAHALVCDIRGADQVIEVRGAHPAFDEVPQAQVRHRDAAAIELAMAANVAVVWARRPGPAAPSTFAYQFPGSVVLEGGTGNRLTPEVGRGLVEGVLRMLRVVGVLAEEDLPSPRAGLGRPVKVIDDQVVRVHANRGGLFLPEGSPWSQVEAGAPLGQVIDPASGQTVERVVSPVAGRLLAVREQPVVLPGSRVARVVTT